MADLGFDLPMQILYVTQSLTNKQKEVSVSTQLAVNRMDCRGLE